MTDNGLKKQTQVHGVVLAALIGILVVGFACALLVLDQKDQDGEVRTVIGNDSTRSNTRKMVQVPGTSQPDSIQAQVVTAVNGSEQGVVVGVIDGDTIDVMIEGRKERVRYIGIDTPETVHPNKPVQCFGREASTKNKTLVQGKQVMLERDVTNRDRYGRLLRYVYVENNLINEVLVREGFAQVYTYPPDVKHDVRFREVERVAREAGLGLWGEACATDVYDETKGIPNHAISDTDGCTIKGNINTQGDKIYHLAGCGSYEKATINESDGERWFCTEDEAVHAGWRKAKNCP